MIAGGGDCNALGDARRVASCKAILAKCDGLATGKAAVVYLPTPSGTSISSRSLSHCQAAAIDIPTKLGPLSDSYLGIGKAPSPTQTTGNPAPTAPLPTLLPTYVLFFPAGYSYYEFRSKNDTVFRFVDTGPKRDADGELVAGLDIREDVFLREGDRYISADDRPIGEGTYCTNLGKLPAAKNFKSEGGLCRRLVDGADVARYNASVEFSNAGKLTRAKLAIGDAARSKDPSHVHLAKRAICSESAMLGSGPFHRSLPDKYDVVVDLPEGMTYCFFDEPSLVLHFFRGDLEPFKTYMNVYDKKTGKTVTVER